MHITIKRPSDEARQLLARDGGARFVADWAPATFIHYAVDPATLQPHVPFPLDINDGRAFVSLVAFEQRRLRPTFGGRLTKWLSAPVANHAFLNVRTYVRVNGERGIYFLAEWIPNRLARVLGPALYGLPYRLGHVNFAADDNSAAIDVHARASGRLTVNVEARRRVNDAAQDDLNAFLVERYVAFTRKGSTARRFRIAHEPWPIRCLAVDDVAIIDDAPLRAFDWFESATLIGAAISLGVRDVAITRPVRLNGAAWHAWLPFAVLPAAALFVRDAVPSWAFMWLLAIAIYAGCKWMTLFGTTRFATMPVRRKLAYLLLWPGMDPAPFMRTTASRSCARLREHIAAGSKIALGIVLIVAAPRLSANPLLIGWLGMIGTVLLLHFGIFHWLALAWKCHGVAVRPLMHHPLHATSVADFWGKRWNAGFHTLAETFVFRPVARRFGIAAGVLATFAASGIVHDAVITLPARSGYGLPTVYFMIQGIAVLIERTRLLRDRAMLRRIIAIACVLLPAPLLLFPPRSVVGVYAPFTLLVHHLIAKGAIVMLSLNPATLIVIGGVLHFGILIASALTPGSLNWRDQLAPLPVMLRKLIWVHGVFIVLVIIAFGTLSLAYPTALASGAALARGVCAFIAVFWLMRLAVQAFIFRGEATPYLRTRLLRWGYHGLTFVFTSLALIYGYAALGGGVS